MITASTMPISTATNAMTLGLPLASVASPKPLNFEGR